MKCLQCVTDSGPVLQAPIVTEQHFWSHLDGQTDHGTNTKIPIKFNLPGLSG